MSEIKGQLLGIVMVLIIFGSVSAAVATVFAKTRDSITAKANNLTDNFEDLLTAN